MTTTPLETVQPLREGSTRRDCFSTFPGTLRPGPAPAWGPGPLQTGRAVLFPFLFQTHGDFSTNSQPCLYRAGLFLVA